MSLCGFTHKSAGIFTKMGPGVSEVCFDAGMFTRLFLVTMFKLIDTSPVILIKESRCANKAKPEKNF